MTATDWRRCRRSRIDAVGRFERWAAVGGAKAASGVATTWGPSRGHRKTIRLPPAVGPIHVGYPLRASGQIDCQNG